MTSVDQIFNDFDGADPKEVGVGGNKIMVAGTHKIRVNKCRVHESEVGTQVYFIVEYTVLESTNENVKPGSEYSVSTDMTKRFGKKKVGIIDVAAFLSAVGGEDPENADPKGREDLETAVADDQPLRGMEVMLKTVPKVTQDEAERKYCRNYWSPVEVA